MSAALPKITVDNIKIIALSSQSPLGMKLIGQQIGYSFEINSSNYTIETV